MSTTSPDTGTRTAAPTGVRELRVGVVGAGRMGSDHVRRLTDVITGASVTAIVEPDEGRAAAAATLAPGSRAFASIEAAIDADALDAVLIATPGFLHEPVLLPALEAGLAILSEKPLTTDSASSLRVLEAEQKLDRPHIQVGFMRRFDAQYRELRALVEAGTAGQLLALRGVHRNPSVPDDYTQEMLITDSVVHEFDVMPWLAGSPIVSVEVKHMRRNSLSPAHLQEPILVLIQLENGVLVDVEMNVSIQYGYQVATEGVFEKGVARTGQPAGLQLWQDQRFSIAEHQSFTTRFADAYDAQVQSWVNAALRGTIDGPSAWDGYLVALACEAGVEALATPGAVEVVAGTKPAFYR